MSAQGAIDQLVRRLGRLPGLGPRSARRAVLWLLTRGREHLVPLADALRAVGEGVGPCSTCGNLDVSDPCGICADSERDASSICVVGDVGDVWALERAGAHGGRYHVLGGVLSALDGIGPDDLRIAGLVSRAAAPDVREVIIALNATVDGQTTAHYLAERLGPCNVAITRLAHGVPVGGELDYLDDGTLAAAMKARR